MVGIGSAGLGLVAMYNVSSGFSLLSMSDVFSKGFVRKIDGGLTAAFNWYTNGVADHAVQAAKQSGFDGWSDGPADAVKHVALAAMLALDKGETRAKLILSGREVLSDMVNYGSNSSMDYINNDLGIKIGAYLREHGGTSEQARALAIELVKKSIDGGATAENWKPSGNGVYRREGQIELSNGLVLDRVALAKIEDKPAAREPEVSALSQILKPLG